MHNIKISDRATDWDAILNIEQKCTITGSDGQIKKAVKLIGKDIVTNLVTAMITVTLVTAMIMVTLVIVMVILMVAIVSIVAVVAVIACRL